ncbi:MAG: hypothetical protein IKY90_07295 [Oscillospiraceae bacterium]|nr:hypothetical protein [Oscillospiraceae bacterium]
MANDKLTHKQQILKHLQKHGSITPLEALQLYGCFRLGARVCDLRKEKHPILTRHADGKRYAVYVWAGNADG